MKKVLMLIAPEGFQDFECAIPKTAFEKSGAKVIIASKGTGKKYGCMDGVMTAEIDYKEVKPEDYDVIVFVGGPGAPVYFDDKIAQDIAKKAYSLGKIVAAICIAPVILARAGLLKGKSATVFPDGKAYLAQAGAKLTGLDVTVDGNIVTANGPKAAKKFSEEIMKIW
jgi:protease I